IRPSAATLPARLEAVARPFSRKWRIAPSMSPAEATSAALQSIMPAPVFSRSSFTFAAVTSTLAYPRGFRRSISRHRRSSHPARRRLVGPAPGRRAFVGAAAAHSLVELGPALEHGVADRGAEQPNGANRVVVARNLVIDDVRVAIRVDHRDHRNAKLVGLLD